LHTRLSGEDLQGNTIWIEDEGIAVPEKKIQSGPRIGVDYAGEDALLPYRFWVDHSLFGNQVIG
jgi:DNA-3-methyladenine glycosylase